MVHQFTLLKWKLLAGLRSDSAANVLKRNITIFNCDFKSSIYRI